MKTILNFFIFSVFLLNPLSAESELSIPSLSSSPAPSPYGAIPTQKQLKLHEMEQYAFCHFTINTFTGKEWGYGDESPELFNPTDLDTDQIVRTTKAAGFKGLILTCKHHDGFCLWPTKSTKHNISASPWKEGKGDLVKEFANSCKKYSIKFGVYLSPWDRNSPYYGTQKYVEIYRQQLTELLSNYGDVFELWLDGANGADGFYGGANEVRKINPLKYYGWDKTWKLCNKLQPNAVIKSDIGPGLRWIGNEKCIAGIPCYCTYTPKGRNGNPPAPGANQYKLNQNGTKNGKFWVPGEADISIRPGWFYHKSEDSQVKTPKALYELYFKSIGRGATFLLNVAPDRRGQLQSNDVYSLTTYGKLIKQLYSKNYAQGATASASITRKETLLDNFSPANVLDGNRYTYWATPDKTSQATLTLELPEKRTFDVIRLREPIQLGQRINAFNLEARVNGKWVPWTEGGKTIGAHTLLRSKQPITADAIRVNITDTSACPLLSEVSLWKQPADIPDTLPITLKKSELNQTNWKIKATSTSSDHPAALAIDGNPKTFWSSQGGGKSFTPQSLTIDFGKTANLSAIEVTPRQDGIADAVVDKYELSWSADGKTWSNPLKGEFSNIRNNPIPCRVELPQPTKVRYIKFTATNVLKKYNVTVAEIKALLAQ